MSEIDFSDITRDDIKKAFEKYDELKETNQLNNNRSAKDYLLFYNSKEYPHKYIVGIAYGLKYNQETLDNTFYNSMGNHKASAQWCIEKNGFILYADKKFKDYLKTKYDNQTTINTYYSDLKKAIKIFQNIERLKDSNLNEIFEIMKNGNINYDEYDKSQKELGFDDKQLFSTLKTKAKVYLESIEKGNINMNINLDKVKEYIIEENKEHRKNILLYLKWVYEDFENRNNVNEKLIRDYFKVSSTFFVEGVKTLDEWYKIRGKKNDYIIRHTTKDSSSWDVVLQLSKNETNELLLKCKDYIPENILTWDYIYPSRNSVINAIKNYDDLEWRDSERKILIDDKLYNFIGLCSIALGIENSLNGNANFYLFSSSKLEKYFSEKFPDFRIIKNNTITELNNLSENNISLNQILYGSPGTGKTFNTINKALEIIDGVVPESRSEAKEKFEQYKKAGQIEFVTFHQSYGYEEFVEGIKAETNGENITYEVKAGIFKELSNRANKNIEQSKENIIIKKEFDVVFKEKILDKLLDNDKLEIKMKKSSFYIKEVDETHISFDKSGGESQHVLLIKNLKLMYEQGENKIIMGGLSQYYNPLLEYLFENSEIKNEEKEPLKNYILIIDEINRGNISKIFGELITLIEPSKRIGADEEIKVKLPYSGKEFGVPKNLYIIGTMNTADRSIAPIDTALRRRFVFEEMPPDSSLLKPIIEKDNEEDTKLELDKLLEAINTRIEYLYDRDHTIGHAYLIDVKTLPDLIFAFKNKIIPLLAEYFYEDWENIKLVLEDKGNKFIIEKENHPALSGMDKNYNKKLYSVNDIDSLEAEDFINIYPKEDNQSLEKDAEIR